MGFHYPHIFTDWAVALFFSASLVLAFRLVLQSRRLTHSRAQLHLILDHMKEGVVVLDREGCIVLMNTVGSRLISVPWAGRPYSEVQRQFECFTPGGVPLPLDQWPSSLALRGQFVTNYHILYRVKGTTEICSRIVSTVPVPSNMCLPGHIIISYTDDSERRRIDEAHTRLAAIVEFSDDGIIGKDTHGIVTSWNRGAERIFGYTAEEMVGSSIKRLFPADRLGEEDEVIGRILSGVRVEHFKTIRVTKAGKPIRVSLTISPIKNGTGAVVGASKIVRDITETHNLERQLQQAQKMEAVGQLTGGIAHDFNNLLGIILGNLELLERDIQVEVANREEGRVKIANTVKLATTARRAAIRAADLTRRLLAFSSKEQLTPALTDLNHSIRNALEMAIRALGPEIAVTTGLASSLPPVLVDPNGLENALLNLAVNARDAMPRGGDLRITSAIVEVDGLPSPLAPQALEPGPYACVSVSDNGEGMSPETLERAFEPFFTTKAPGQGTGLGLAMVYGFVKQSNGSARIYSEPGHGTTVSLYLPLAGDLPASTLLPIYEHLGPHHATILLVDDEPDLLDLAATYLKRVGYTVLRAGDANHALKVIAASTHLDMMLTDIIMPGPVNGVELARRAHLIRPGLKIVYTSGYSADALDKKSFAPIDGVFLRKPYRLVELNDIIQRELHRESAPVAENASALVTPAN